MDTRTPERYAIETERERCAQEVEALTMGDILLAAGEMTAGERRTCKALLAFVAHRIRNPKKKS